MGQITAVRQNNDPVRFDLHSHENREMVQDLHSLPHQISLAWAELYPGHLSYWLHQEQSLLHSDGSWNTKTESD